jgi:anti-sigma factor RsiW
MSEPMYRARFLSDHRWTPGRMSDYLDGELGSSRRTRLERHVRDCPECGRLLADLRRILDALHRLPSPRGEADALAIAASVRLRLTEPPAS